MEIPQGHASGLWILQLLDQLGTSSGFFCFFSILINASPSTTFSASRGIRQGGPLSLYLFIILAEGIGIFIKVQVQENHVLGIKLDDIDKVHSCL